MLIRSEKRGMKPRKNAIVDGLATKGGRPLNELRLLQI